LILGEDYFFLGENKKLPKDNKFHHRYYRNYVMVKIKSVINSITDIIEIMLW